MESRSIVEEGLKKAIEAESTGYHFYIMAASKTQDDKGREIFESLAAEELDHIRFLKAQLASLLETGTVLDGLALASHRINGDETSPIFSDDIKHRINEAHFEMSALSIGIQLELSAIKYYREQVELNEDKSVKAMYRALAEWEQGHYDMLVRQQNMLKEDYWSSGGFTPY